MRRYREKCNPQTMLDRCDHSGARLRFLAVGSIAFVAATAGVMPAQAATDEASDPETPAAPAAPAETPLPPLPNGSVFVDPLGFLLFGPTVGVELRIEQFSVMAYGRWLSAGVLAKSLFLKDNDEFAFSFGGGVKARYYFRPGLTGPHLGVALELLKTRVENDVSQVAVNNTIFVPELEGGYRFGFGRFYLGPAIGIGYAIQAAKSVENIGGGDRAESFVADDVSTVYGSANLDVGILF